MTEVIDTCTVCQVQFTPEELANADHTPSTLHQQHKRGCTALVTRDPQDCNCPEIHYAHPQCCPSCNASLDALRALFGANPSIN